MPTGTLVYAYDSGKALLGPMQHTIMELLRSLGTCSSTMRAITPLPVTYKTFRCQIGPHPYWVIATPLTEEVEIAELGEVPS